MSATTGGAVPVTPRESLKTWSWPKRIVSGWWLLLGLMTLLLVADTDLDVTFRHFALSYTLETVNALVATMVAFVGFARYVFERRPFDLAVAGAFGAIAITAVIFGLILPFSGYTPRDLGDAPIYGWIVTRLIAGALLLAGLRTALPGRPTLARVGAWLVGLFLCVLLADFALWFSQAWLPQLLKPSAWQILNQNSGTIAEAILPGQTMLGIALEVGLAGVYLILAIRLSLAATTIADAWLALAMITAAVAEFQFVFYPAPFHPAVTTADLLWLISYLLLLAYLGHQYLRIASGMRRQQERTSALLELSQTVVADRDRDLIVEAARRAAQAVAAEATVAVVLDGAQPPPLWGAVQTFPVETDGTHYGWLLARPTVDQRLEPDAKEYLRIVATQTANLLRAIDLYGELADSAVREERAQLARELHDGLAQDLAVLRLRLGKAAEPDKTGLVDRALSEARYAITILRGQTAVPADFLQALERLAEDLGDRFDCPVTVEQQSRLSTVPAPIQVALLRVIREAVTNAGKHGAPRRIAVHLAERAGRIDVTVSDDGRGFDPTVPPPPDRFGLRGMAERVQALGGNLAIESRPGAGTSVHVTLPATSPDGAS